MIEVTRRRLLLGAVCAVLVLLPVAGWSATRPSSHPGRPAAASPTGMVTPSAPDPSASGPGAAPSAGAPSMPPPIGWKLSDVPAFGPPPPPEPIVLPPGGEVPFLSRVPVNQLVAFLTIDDGYLKPGEAPKLLAAAHIPVTLFLTTDAIRDNVPFFDRLRQYGAVIEAHTISHPKLRGTGEQFQHHQICDGTDRLAQWYGRRPLLFRPPFGDKDHTTLRVAKGCGLKAAFMWKETVDKGKVRYQEGRTVQPGDIILMHFRPAFVKDFLAALHAIKKAGLTPALLEDYVPGASVGVPPLTPPPGGASPSPPTGSLAPSSPSSPSAGYALARPAVGRALARPAVGHAPASPAVDYVPARSNGGFAHVLPARESRLLRRSGGHEVTVHRLQADRRRRMGPDRRL